MADRALRKRRIQRADAQAVKVRRLGFNADDRRTAMAAEAALRAGAGGELFQRILAGARATGALAA